MPYGALVRNPTQPDQEWDLVEGLVFDTGPEAGEWVKRENHVNKQFEIPIRYKVANLGPNDPRLWRQREQQKIDDGTYQKVPWCDYYSPAGMYEHVDPENPTLVRFIASGSDGMSGRYTRMSPARFIMKYIDSYPQASLVDKWCASMGLELTVSALKFATTPEDIVRVYNEGPHSCMAYATNDGNNSSPFYARGIHPVAPYGNTELAVAYIMRRGEITARSLVWPEKKIHGRIYGDEARLLERLKENDYIEDWDGFVGSKIRRIIDSRGNLVVPYFDGDGIGAKPLDDEWLEITNEPTLILKSPYGVVLQDHCQQCGAQDVHLRKEPVPDQDNDEDVWYICAKGCQ